MKNAQPIYSSAKGHLCDRAVIIGQMSTRIPFQFCVYSQYQFVSELRINSSASSRLFESIECKYETTSSSVGICPSLLSILGKDLSKCPHQDWSLTLSSGGAFPSCASFFRSPKISIVSTGVMICL